MSDDEKSEKGATTVKKPAATPEQKTPETPTPKGKPSEAKPKAKDANGDDGMHMKPGEVIVNGKRAYVVDKLLGEGGFGAVYRVHDRAEKHKEYALKAEKKLSNRKHSKLKMEARPRALVAILKLVVEERSADISHFTACIDRGKKENFFFLVMELVGKSLDDLKRLRSSKVFSMGTGIGAGIQCLEAVEDLHKHGFIHRDLKPANYACGLKYKRHIIYLLDFGIARRYKNDNGELKAPRSYVAFKGTVRFCAINCHKCVELGPKDDLESWLYLLLDLVVQNGLPWNKYSCAVQENRDLALKCKLECRAARRAELFDGLRCADTFGRILAYIDGLQYADRPDYNHVYNLLHCAANECGVNPDAPYDWEMDAPAPTFRGARSKASTARSN
ncbi:Tau-tubulin kinase 2 [Aphelenchoides fujianensis]|nr:Tau-tubulin kinase 2 [Aphelenchoides fujianensis]